MTIALKLNEDDAMLFKKYAELNGMTVSEFVRRCVIERIEDEYDLTVYEEAMEEFKKNPITYSLDEVEKELGII